MYFVNPKYTSQECSVCHHIDADNRDNERFICTACGHIDDANFQAARNVKVKAIKQYGLEIKKRKTVMAGSPRGDGFSKKVRRDSVKPFKEPIQLELWQTPTLELTRSKRRQQGAKNGKRLVPGNPSDWDILSVNSLESPLF